MSTASSLAWIPLRYFVFLFGTMMTLLALVWVVQRRVQQKSTPGYGSRITRGLLYAGRLVSFTLATFVVVVFSLMLFAAYTSVPEETVPAPQAVELLPNMPFEVEEVTFTGGDDPAGGQVRLAGWYVPPENGSIVILLHGYGGTRVQMMNYAQPLAAAGYGVLLYDERASGESSGSRRSYGMEDAPDVNRAITYLRGRNEAQQARMGIVGCSIGGQIALQAAAQYPELEAVWADGPATLRASDYPQPKHWLTWLLYPSQYIVDWMYMLRLNIDAPPPLIEQLPWIAPRPIMLVGGGTSRPYFGSEEDLMQRYAQAAGPNAQVWIIPEAIHCDGLEERPEEYAGKLVDFFDEVLKP